MPEKGGTQIRISVCTPGTPGFKDTFINHLFSFRLFHKKVFCV